MDYFNNTKLKELGNMSFMKFKDLCSNNIHVKDG